MTIIIALILTFFAGLLFGGAGFVVGFITGFIKGLRVDKAESEELEKAIHDMRPVQPRVGLQVSHSKREQKEMRSIADDVLPRPNILKTLEDRAGRQE